MRISLFIPDFEEGGAQKMMVNLANSLAEKSVSVDLVVACNQGSFNNLVNTNVNVVPLDCARTLHALPKLVRYINSEKPDVIISALYHANVICLAAKCLSKKSRTKFIVTERNHLSSKIKNSNSVKDKILLPAIKFLYPKADSVIAISKGVMDDVVELCALNDDKISYIHNPVVTPSFEKEIKSHSELLFPDSTLPLIIASGRLVEQKDYPTMLKAMALILKKKPANLAILGKGPLQKELAALSKELGIENNVTFKDFVENPLSYMKQADIFLMTSAWEGFGNVLVEALYCGLSIVATDCPSGPAEILDNGKYGYLTNVGDEIDISNAVLKVMESPFDKEQQKKRAMKFTTDSISDKYLRHVKGLIR
ncbi:MAG: glycosyltransferase [Alphaproteobacteria bacterium]|nr:glycosyltransferase [Alphaproteobacteria bacterium]